jgi:hypothetical protein
MFEKFQDYISNCIGDIDRNVFRDREALKKVAHMLSDGYLNNTPVQEMSTHIHHALKNRGLIMLKSCECEHEAHFLKHGANTFKGHRPHKYGVYFAESYVIPVKTPLGTFNVCKSCADDCYCDEALDMIFGPNWKKECLNYE